MLPKKRLDVSGGHSRRRAVSKLAGDPLRSQSSVSDQGRVLAPLVVIEMPQILVDKQPERQVSIRLRLHWRSSAIDVRHKARERPCGFGRGPGK